jgi:predicted KAP-like P-loop ATPase
MTQQSNSLPPLSLGRSEFVGEQAFEGDLLSRKKLAERLTGYLDRLKEGAVLAIDAQWGDGKTWFGRNWAKSLEDNGHKVVFIDAFEQDYIEDPFLLIAAEITEALNNGNEGIQELREKAAGVMKAILPVGTKALINIAGRIVLGSGGFSEEIKDAVESANDATADAASEWIKSKLQDHAQEKASLQHFRNELEAVANAQEKPIVIFIDELDRCRPTFAVRLIERIKHFFDVPNVVFVLLINRNQLEKAIKGVYGSETDAAAYLGKFINFFFFLPKQRTDESITNSRIRSYVSTTLNRYKFDPREINHSNFGDVFSLLAKHFDLSLRDIEKGIALYAFAQPIHKDLYDFLAYEITLKITKPALFRRLIQGETRAHEEAKAQIDSFQGADWFRDSMSGLHNAHITHNFTDFGEVFKNSIPLLSRLHLHPENLFVSIAQHIDLPMEI